MAKTFFYSACILILATLSSFLAVRLYVAESNPELTHHLTWTRRSAAAAEAVAALKCSGHGEAFLDSLFIRGVPQCECNTCYGGLDCSLLIHGCSADVISGNPLFLEPYWKKHKALTTITVSGWHRMSYVFPNDAVVSPVLEKTIRQLHETVGNAKTEGRYIMFGTGTTNLLNAAIHALSANRSNANQRAQVVAKAPFYPTYKTQTDWFRSVDYTFAGNALNFLNSTNSTSEFVEIVTSPSNPEGYLERATLNGPGITHFYDHVYYWPHYTAIPYAADEDIMLFSLSKSTGHAGTRFGWAIIKDKRVYDSMVEYMGENTHASSRDSQARVIYILREVIRNVGTETDFFKFGYEILRHRWATFKSAFVGSTRFSIQHDAEPRYCSYFKEIRRAPSHGYGWVKCLRKDEKDCYAVFKAAGVLGESGSKFLSGSRYVRLSLLKTDDDFNLMMTRVRALLSKEDDGYIAMV